MADINKLGRVNGAAVRNVDLQQNTLVVGSLKVGSVSPTELTKTLLDSLVALEADYTGGNLEAAGSNVSIAHSAVNYSPAGSTLENHIAAIDTALGSAVSTEFSDATFRIQNDIDPSKQIEFDASAISASTTRTITMPNFDVNLGDIASNSTAISDLQTLSGVAANAQDLGSFSGSIISDNSTIKGALQELETEIENLPTPMQYVGTWNASTNSPSLADGIGSAGQLYRVNVAGTQNLGSGNITYNVGDKVVYNGSIWEKWDTNDEVTSVNSQTGDVVLDTDDINEGASNFYYTEGRFDTSLAAKDTDDLSEGMANLYFTDARAKTAVVDDAIVNGVTDKAPSQNAVFDALALKFDSANFDSSFDTRLALKSTSDLAEGTNLYFTEARVRDTDLLGFSSAPGVVSASDTILEAIEKLDGNINNIELESTVRNAPIGETASAGIKAFRWAKPALAETSGRLYKADNDASVNDNFYSVGLYVASGSEVAGDAITIVKAGKIAAASHGFTVGAPIYLGAAGVLTNTAPTAADTAVVLVGFAQDANTIDVQIQVMGVN
jgi:hypothetical protein